MTNHTVTPGSGELAVKGEPPSTLIHQAAGLVQHTRTLATLCQTAGPEQPALVIATYLTATAAIEATLSERAHDHERALYDDEGFRGAGAPGKYERLCHKRPPDELIRIWKVRNALTHSEPNNARTGGIGDQLTAAKVEAAAECVESLWKIFLR